MKNVSEITLSHSERRPRASAWCASSNGRKTYARTREEALEHHKNALEECTRMAVSLKYCAECTACTELS